MIDLPSRQINDFHKKETEKKLSQCTDGPDQGELVGANLHHFVQPVLVVVEGDVVELLCHNIQHTHHPIPGSFGQVWPLFHTHILQSLQNPKLVTTIEMSKTTWILMLFRQSQNLLEVL